MLATISLTAFQYLKTFLIKLGVMLTKLFLIVYNKISQHLEDLHNLVDQYYPNDRGMLLQNYTWVNQDESMDFSAVEYEKLIHLV